MPRCRSIIWSMGRVVVIGPTSLWLADCAPAEPPGVKPASVAGSPGRSVAAPVQVRFIAIRIGKMNGDSIALEREQPALRRAAAEDATLDLQAIVAYPASAGGS